jgi:tetratricopeptide (TPR) repeat protein
MECFERARELDPAFPQAWTGLADAYLRMAFTFEPEGDWYNRAETMCQRALDLDPNLPEAHYTCGRLAWTPRAGFQTAVALREYCLAIAGRPGLAEAHLWLGTVLQHVSLFDEAAASLQRALDIDPDNLLAFEMLALTRYYQGRFEEGRALTARAAERDETAWRRYQLALCEIQVGDRAAAEKLAAQGQREFPYSVLMHSIEGLLAALDGDAGGARAAVERVEERRQAFGHYHHAQYDIACIFALLADPGGALEYLAAAAANGFPCGDFFAIDPLLASLRGTPAFRALLARLDAEKARYGALYAEARSDAA